MSACRRALPGLVVDRFQHHGVVGTGQPQEPEHRAWILIIAKAFEGGAAGELDGDVGGGELGQGGTVVRSHAL